MRVQTELDWSGYDGYGAGDAYAGVPAADLTWTVIANESDKAWPLMRHLRSWREGLASSSAAPRRAD